MCAMSERKRKWKLTANTTIWAACRENEELILGGVVMAVDPSCGSRSSMPGYAVYRAGGLSESGTIQIPDITRPLPYRLQDLGSEIANMYLRVEPDVLVVEELPVRRFGGGSATAHASLLKSAGAIFATAPARTVITIRPQAWRQLAHADWYKDDEQDAIAMGHAVVAVARAVRAERGDE